MRRLNAHNVTTLATDSQPAGARSLPTACFQFTNKNTETLTLRIQRAR